MKKYLLVVLYTAFSLNCLAQNKLIEYRKILDNGENLSIKTVPVEIVVSKEPILDISLMYETKMKENPSMSGYSLFLFYYSRKDGNIIPLNGKLLIRTTSGKVISLSQSTDNGITLFNGDDSFETSVYIPSEWMGDGWIFPNYYRKFGKYPISESDLNAIINEGIIKIRIETTAGSIEGEYNKTKKIMVNGKKESRNIVSAKLLPYYNALIENLDPYTTF